eukprot:324806-Lingulodinium_polyedra.AAC.1
MLQAAGSPPALDASGRGDEDRRVLALVGKARAGTIRNRVRAWESFTRWMRCRYSQEWPDNKYVVMEYIRSQVDVPAPATFPARFGATLRWVTARAGLNDDFVEDPE